MNIVKIGDRILGNLEPALVIAEIGVNHDGDVRRALELVRIAADCGADAVKIQLFRADRLMHRSSSFANYQTKTTADATPINMLRRLEFSPADVRIVVGEIRRLGLIPLATPFSPEDVAAIESLELPAIKIASPDLVNWPLLRRATATGKPMLISTGAATMDEVAAAVDWLREWRTPAALLHCISSYPTPAEQANLCWISELREKFAVPVGLSDHTAEDLAGGMAVMAGACVIEKHITYDIAAPGPDHSASCPQERFSQYVRHIRLAEKLRGRPGKRVLEIEADVRAVSRQSLVATEDLAPGRLIKERDLTVQRPGIGIPAAAWPTVIGRRVGRPVRAGQLLDWSDFSDAA